MLTSGKFLTSLVAVLVLVAFPSTEADEKPSSCCKTVSRTEFPEPITGYWVQLWNAPCIQAIIFQTEKGLMCSYLKAPWVQRKIKEFKRARLTTGSPSRSATSSLPPSPSSPSPSLLSPSSASRTSSPPPSPPSPSPSNLSPSSASRTSSPPPSPSSPSPSLLSPSSASRTSSPPPSPPSPSPSNLSPSSASRTSSPPPSPSSPSPSLLSRLLFSSASFSRTFLTRFLTDSTMKTSTSAQ